MIRELRAADIPELVDMHMIAFRDHLNILAGKRYVRHFFQWFIDNREAINIVAVDENGIPQGYVIGAPWGYQTGMNRDLAGMASVEIMKRPWILLNQKVLQALWLRLKTLLGLNKHIDEVRTVLNGKIISLVGIAVSEQAKGKGLASSLIQEFENRCRQAGFDYMRLSVYARNTVARRFYEKSGWQPMENDDSQAKILSYFKKLTP